MQRGNFGRTQFEHNESAYPPIADIRADIADGSDVPISGIHAPRQSAKLLHHLVGAQENRRWDVQTEDDQAGPKGDTGGDRTSLSFHMTRGTK